MFRTLPAARRCGRLIELDRLLPMENGEGPNADTGVLASAQTFDPSVRACIALPCASRDTPVDNEGAIGMKRQATGGECDVDEDNGRELR